jgi:hypothetical protein
MQPRAQALGGIEERQSPEWGEKNESSKPIVNSFWERHNSIRANQTANPIAKDFGKGASSTRANQNLK